VTVLDESGASILDESGHAILNEAEDPLTLLYYAYLAAAGVHAQLQSNWHLIRQASLSDGTAGMLYAQLYTAEQAKDNAWTAWDNLRKIQNPAPPTN